MAALCLAQPLLAQTIDTGPRYALVIGNGDYTELGKLKNPKNDAADMAEALRKLNFDVELLIDADIVSMEDGANRLGVKLATSPKSMGFFFYAGHGVQYNGHNYLIPSDAHISDEAYLENKTLDVQSVLNTFRGARNELNVIVLDACRDNPFGWARSGTRGLSIPGSQPTGSIIVYATGAGSVAMDGSGRNGVFTQELLKHIQTPGLEIKEIFNRTGAAVQAATSGVQVPAVYSQFFGSAYLAGSSVASKNQKLHISGVKTITYLPISGNINISHLTLFASGVTTVSTSDYGTTFDGFNTFETQNGLYGIWHVFRSFNVISGKLKFNQTTGNWQPSSDSDVSTVYAPSSNQFLNFFFWNGNLFELGCSHTSGTIYSRVYDKNSSRWVSFSPSMDGVYRFQTMPSVYIDSSNTLHGIFTYACGSVYPTGVGTYYFDHSASPKWQRTGSFAHEYLSTLQTGIEGKWLFFWRDGTTNFIDEYDPTTETIVNRLTFTINDLIGYGRQNIETGTLFKQNDGIYLSLAYTPYGNFRTNGSPLNLGIMKIAELTY